MGFLIKQILFATDFSACADRAMGYALNLAESRKAKLSAVTVLELYPGMDPDYTVNKMYLDHLRAEADRQLGCRSGTGQGGRSTDHDAHRSRVIPSQALQTVAQTGRGGSPGSRYAWPNGSRSCLGRQHCGAGRTGLSLSRPGGEGRQGRGRCCSDSIVFPCNLSD
ncbi:MAG: universal stress protein, partial [Nitrospira sp.]